MSRRSWIITGVVAAVLALSGVTTAIALSAGDEEELTGPAAEKAKAAALRAVGGGEVEEVERESDDPGAYGVEVRRSDGSEVEVQLDEDFRPVATETEEDEREEADEDGDEE